MLSKGGRLLTDEEIDDLLYMVEGKMKQCERVTDRRYWSDLVEKLKMALRRG